MILNYDPKKRSSKTPVMTTRMLDLTEQGIRRLLYELNSTDTDQWGEPVGYIPSKRKELKAALKDWENYRAGQHLLDKKSPPKGIWAERVNKIRAHIAIGEEESRKLSKMKTAQLAAKKEPELGPTEKMALAAHLKFRNGKLSRVAGREIGQDAKGHDIFLDDGSSGSKYLENLKRVKPNG